MRIVSVRRLALLAVVSAGLAGCSSMGPTADENDPDSVTPSGSLGRAVMEGLGAVPARQQPMDYTPRAPLVVPPTNTALTPPEAKQQVASLDNWPKDPEKVEAARLKAASDREKARGDGQIPPSELMAIRVPPRTTTAQVTDIHDQGRPPMRSEFDKMPKKTGVDASGVYDAEGKPQRKALVQPPVAYLEPAPGAPVTTEEPKKDEKSFWKRMFNW